MRKGRYRDMRIEMCSTYLAVIFIPFPNLDSIQILKRWGIFAFKHTVSNVTTTGTALTERCYTQHQPIPEAKTITPDTLQGIMQPIKPEATHHQLPCSFDRSPLTLSILPNLDSSNSNLLRFSLSRPSNIATLSSSFALAFLSAATISLASVNS